MSTIVVRRAAKVKAKTVKQMVVEWLWTSRIRSRASFLTILQFINVGTDTKMMILKEMLSMMRKLGEKFFRTHVLKKQDPFVD